MAAMFSNTRPTASSSGHIVEFKAGRSRLEPGTGENMRRVVGEPTKGLVYIKQSSDMLVHFCWKDRESGALVDDLIIFPDDAEFKAVNGCPDGKVYMLKFKSSGEMKLFWLQDSSPDADKDLVKKVNDALNKPPATRISSSRSAASNSNADRSSAGGSTSTMEPLQDFGAPLGGLDQGQLLSLIQSLQGNNGDSLSLPQSGASSQETSSASGGEADCEPPVTEMTTASDVPSRSDQLSLDNPAIASILNNFGRKKSPANISLAEVLSNETVAEVAREHAAELAPHLPPTGNVAQELAETVRTPQFRQAADTLGAALQTGQLGPVLQQFGMNDETIAAANSGDLKEFARKLTVAEGGAESSGSTRPLNCRKAVMPSAYLGLFSPSIAATVSRLASSETSDDDVAREPEPKRNRPDNEDMDID